MTTLKPISESSPVYSLQQDLPKRSEEERRGLFSAAVDAAVKAGSSPEQARVIDILPTHAKVNTLFQMSWRTLMLQPPSKTREQALRRYKEKQAATQEPVESDQKTNEQRTIDDVM